MRPMVATPRAPEPIGQAAEERPRNHEADREGDQGDAGPQRRLGEAVPVLGQPDALQPDDQHELDAHHDRWPTGTRPGQTVVKARIRNSCNRIMGWGTLNSIRTKTTRRTTPPMTPASTFGIGPSHGVPAVGLNAVDDPGQQGDEADGEGDVPQPVDFGGDPDPVVLQLEVGPHRPEQPEGHRDQEDEPPFDRGQDAAEDQADERPRDQGDAVDAHGLAPFVLGEGVGEDGARVGEQERRHRCPAPPA